MLSNKVDSGAGFRGLSADVERSPAAREDERFLTAAQVADRYSLSKMTLWRWCNEERYQHLKFPCPMKLGSQNYWRLSKLVEWEDSQGRRAA